MKAAKGWDEGEEGNLLESPLPKLFVQVHGTVPLRRRQPSRSGPPVLWRDCPDGSPCTPCIVMSGWRQQRVPARQREAFSKTPRATAAEGAGLPAEAGEDFLFYTVSPWRAKAMPALACCRSVTDISPAQPTGWTNPALWSATNQENFCFLRAGSCGWRRCPLGTKGRDGQIFAQRRQESDGWFRERGKRWRGGGRARAVKTGKDGSGIRGQAGMPHRAAVQKVPAALGLRRKEKVRPCVRFRSHTEHRHVPGRRACLLLTIQDRTLLQKVLP